MTGYSLKSVKGFITADVLTAPDGNIQLGNVTISNTLGNVDSTDFLPFSLTINPENLVINVDATEAGDDIHWVWTWQQTTLPYARATITNQQQLSVPIYKDGSYVLNNFAANTVHGNMTQTHHGYFKWIDGAGLDNLIDWVGNYTTTTVSHPSINGGANTAVQQYSFTVPSSITIPTLTAPNITYDVSVANGGYYMANMAGEGTNVTLGPVRRGGTYTFNLDSSLVGHEFYLTTDNGTGFIANGYVGEYTTGVTGSRNDGSTGKTTLVWHVANTAPDTLFYQSARDANLKGAITVKDLAVETNINGNPVVYFQHMHEGHKTPIEIKPIPTMVNQMCLVYDANLQEFVPQDMATYVDNTPSFKNKIREVAGTATLVAPSGVSLVPTVLVVENVSYLPLVNNKDGDIAFDTYTDTLYVWGGNTWNSTKPNTVSASSITGTVANATSAVTANTAGTVTTNAQPNVTSVRTLANLTAGGNINLTTASNISLGNISNIHIAGGSANYVIKTDGAGNLSWTAQSGGLTTYTKTYLSKGAITEATGTLRYYIHATSTMTAINAYLGTAGLTQTVAVVKKNGTSINTITIPANTTTLNQTGLSISLAAGDYLTVDITQGSSATDLYINFVYQG
jgi:hypothetical protein